MYDVKEPTRGYQNYNSSQILIFSGYAKVKVSLYTQVILWVNAILDHIDTTMFLPIYGGPCMVDIYIYIYVNGIG